MRRTSCSALLRRSSRWMQRMPTLIGTKLRYLERARLAISPNLVPGTALVGQSIARLDFSDQNGHNPRRSSNALN